MKIDKIQCDICGKVVDYNNNIFSLLTGDQKRINCYMDLIKENKSNRLRLRGLARTVKDLPYLVNIDYDLCEECLLKICNMIKDLSERSRA